MLDPELLRTFVAIAETGSFTEAANRVHRTQSAVSMQMKRLEDLLGKRLFDKSGRGIAVSGEGEVLLLHARRLLQMHRDVLAAVQEGGVDGRVRIGAPDDYAVTYLPPILDRFGESHPKVEVEMVIQPSNELRRLLLQEDGVDMALLTQAEAGDDGITLVREPLVWVTSATHCVHERDPVPLAIYTPPCAFRNAMLAALAECGRAYRIAYSTVSIAGIQAALTSGQAVSTLLRPTVPPGMRILTEADGFPALPGFGLVFVRPKRASSPAANALARHVMESIGVDADAMAA